MCAAGIAVSTVAHVGVEEAADTALAHLLALYRRTVGLALAPFGAPATGSARDPNLGAINMAASADGGVQPTRIRGQTLGIVGLGECSRSLLSMLRSDRCSIGYRLTDRTVQ